MALFAYILPPETAQIHCGAAGLALLRRPYMDRDVDLVTAAEGASD